MKDRVVEMKEELEKIKAMSENHSLATEMLQELKTQNKRLHITNMILIAVIVAMVIGFFVYTSQFEIVGEETTVDAGNGTATYLENSNTGDINYGEDN